VEELADLAEDHEAVSNTESLEELFAIELKQEYYFEH
jgi:hypothetical protein